MKTFQINNEAVIVCDWKKTKTAFKHEATLLVNGVERDTTKICYLNRTWEAYEFESVIEKLLDKTQYLNEAERKAFLDKCAGRTREEVKSMFGAIGAVALMGEIFHAGNPRAINADPQNKSSLEWSGFYPRPRAWPRHRQGWNYLVL